MIRTALVIVAGGFLTFVLAGWIVVSSALRLPGIRACCESFPRIWGRTILALSGARVRLEGFDRVDWGQPLIVVANHQSWFDVFALLAHLPTTARFVAKEELGRIPVFGAAWRACGHISVDRSDRSQAIASLGEAGTRVRDERLAVIIFPEGTRSPDGRLRPFKKGAFVLAVQTGVPILPVGISGSRHLMPKGSFRIRSGEMRMRVGEPIRTVGLGMGDRDRLLAAARSAVAQLMDDPEVPDGSYGSARGDPGPGSPGGPDRNPTEEEGR